MRRRGDKTYRYGYLDKVLSVTEGEQKYTYDYHVDGQLARADYGNGKAEDFGWDGLALIKRGDERFVNEPHVGGGNPVVSSKGTKYFNDILGTTLGAKTKGRKYTPAAHTAFGERLDDTKGDSPAIRSFSEGWYTGKPHVAGLGHAFLFRNYRAGLAKWQTADPLGYPDGWNQLAYCGNGVTSAVDLCGAKTFETNDKWYDDPVRHFSDFLYTGYDASVGMWYNLYQDYDKIVHHHEYDVMETDDDWLGEILKGISDGANRLAIISELAAGASLVVLGVSAVTGNVPMATVSFVVMRAVGTATEILGSVAIAGAVASELYNGRRSHLTPIDHKDDTSESIFNYRFRRVYFE